MYLQSSPSPTEDHIITQSIVSHSLCYTTFISYLYQHFKIKIFLKLEKGLNPEP